MTDRRALAALLVTHLAMVAIVMPRGDFPINDDWAFAPSVEWLLSEGRIRLSDAVGMNLVPQTLLGALAVKALGPGFETLRHVTQAVALACAFAAYAWFRATRLDAGAALAATLAVMAFPAWAVLSSSYMTDMYGFALVFASSACFMAALRSPRSPWLLALATLLAVAGVLQRQVALVVPFAFMVAALWTARPLRWRDVARAVFPFAAAVAAAMLFNEYLEAGPGVPSGQKKVHDRLMPMLTAMLTGEDDLWQWGILNALAIASYLGLFAVGWFGWWGAQGASRPVRWAMAAGGLAFAACAIALPWLPPYRADNVMDAAGIGPMMLHDTMAGLVRIDRSAGWFWTIVAVPAAFATVGLAASVAAATGAIVRARRDADPVLVFTLAAIAAYLGPFIATDFFDRYLLYVLPFAFALWAATWREGPARPAARRMALAWIVVAIVLGTVATRDYFSWQRVRWDALRDLERAGIPSTAIDGGLEYNALRRYGAPQAGPARYVVAFGPVPGYRVMRVTQVPHWLPRSPSAVWLLERKVE